MWVSQISGTTKWLASVCFTSANCGTTVGYTGTILRTANGGVNVKKIGSEISDKYILYQNFSNPFNPNTNIKFKTARYGGSSTLIKLTVFDILGKEVATLVNEKLKPGEYEVAFNGSGLASGVYFYKFVAGDFTDIKRMVLIK